MDHSHQLGEHVHPETFDEVIARGFPHKDLKALAKAHKERMRGRQAPRAARLPRATAAVAATTRKDQASSGLSLAEQTAFKGAIVQLVEEGKYLELTQIHADMSHNMHGSMGEVGLYRFLAWHRRYLLGFERELQRVDAILSRPDPLPADFDDLAVADVVIEHAATDAIARFE